MMVPFRFVLTVFAILSLGVGLSACGMWRGSNDVSTDYGQDAMDEGPGLITGKRGGIVIYQK